MEIIEPGSSGNEIALVLGHGEFIVSFDAFNNVCNRGAVDEQEFHARIGIPAKTLTKYSQQPASCVDRYAAKQTSPPATIAG